MKLFKQDAIRNGVKYTNLYACWSYQGKDYVVRIRSVFPCDNDKLFSVAESVDMGETIAKYL